MSWFGYASAKDVSKLKVSLDANELEAAKEAARDYARRAKEEKERAGQERIYADEAREEAAASATRAEVAEEQALKQSHRAHKERERAERERMDAAKAKEEAAASANKYDQAAEQIQREKQKAREAQTMASEQREIAEEAREQAKSRHRELSNAETQLEELQRRKGTVEQERQRLQDEKEEKQRRDDMLMKYAWGPSKKEKRMWRSEEVNRLRNKFLEHTKDMEGKLICGKVLIFGPSGAGKSSFCNGLRSALMNDDTPSSYHAVGCTDSSFTSNFEPVQYGDHWIIDMPGIFESSDFFEEHIEAIASGKIRFDEQITNPKTLYVKEQLQEARKDVSCVVLVLQHGIILGEEVKNQLNIILRLGGAGVLSFHLVLTHLDECDPQFKDPDNIPNLYDSPLVQESVEKISEQTGIPGYAISYVKNYATETVTHRNTKLLHLIALDRILTSAIQQVNKKITKTHLKNLYEGFPDTREVQYPSEERKDPSEGRKQATVERKQPSGERKQASEERKVSSQEIKDESVDWTMPVLTSVVGIGLAAMVYACTKQM